jgi:hypothetical protein
MSPNGMARPRPAAGLRLGRRYAKLKEHAMRTSQKTVGSITTIGIDLGKNTFHLVGLDKRGAVVLQQRRPAFDKTVCLKNVSVRFT